jgi:hypothetical protein
MSPYYSSSQPIALKSHLCIYGYLNAMIKCEIKIKIKFMSPVSHILGAQSYMCLTAVVLVRDFHLHRKYNGAALVFSLCYNLG